MKWLVGWLLINCDGLFKKICRVGHTQRDRVGPLRQSCRVLKMITSLILNRSLWSVNCSSTDSLFPAWSYIKLIRISFLACLLKMSDFISTTLLPTHTQLLTKKKQKKNIRKYLQWPALLKKQVKDTEAGWYWYPVIGYWSSNYKVAMARLFCILCKKKDLCYTYT